MYGMDDVELQRMQEFISRKNAQVVEFQRNDPKWLASASDGAREMVNNGDPYFGFIDLYYSIIVSPTTVGDGYLIHFKYPGLEEKLNVTNYDVW